MKRDARIGLAVVLVLGLMVTLLVGRALYKSTPTADANPDDGAETSTSTAAASEDAHRVDSTTTQPTPANAPVPTASPLSNDTARAEMVSLPENQEQNTAVQQFVDNQTRPLHEPAATVTPALATPPAVPHETGTRGGGAHNVKPTNGNPHDDLLGDHEVGPIKNDDPAPVEGFGYTVVTGDNIWKISSKVYGDGKFTQKIVEANKDVNTAKLKVGQVIHIPVIQNKTILMKLPAYADAKAKSGAGESAVAAKTDKKPAPSAPAAAQKLVKAEVSEPSSAAVEATTHKVEAGETLGAIAKKYYGTSGPKTISKIVEANKGLDPAKLKVGQEIVIPAKK